MTRERKTNLLRLVLAAVFVLVIVMRHHSLEFGNAILLSPVMFIAIYLWLGVAFFFLDLIWIALTKPEERLFAINMLSGAVMVMAAFAAGYWLIHDSIGTTATVIYAIVAYFALSVVRWFRRHTASYYAALEAEQHSKSTPSDEEKRQD